MSFIKALAAALNALAAFLQYVYPAKQLREISKDIEKYEDEIFDLGFSGTAADKLRIEIVAKRKKRADQQLAAIQSIYGDSD